MLLLWQINFSSSVQHENIVRLLDVFMEKQQLVIVVSWHPWAAETCEYLMVTKACSQYLVWRMCVHTVTFLAAAAAGVFVRICFYLMPDCLLKWCESSEAVSEL